MSQLAIQFFATPEPQPERDRINSMREMIRHWQALKLKRPHVVHLIPYDDHVIDPVYKVFDSDYRALKRLLTSDHELHFWEENGVTVFFKSTWFYQHQFNDLLPKMVAMGLHIAVSPKAWEWNREKGAVLPVQP